MFYNIKYKNNFKVVMALSIQSKVYYCHLEMKYYLFPLTRLFVEL